jgi:hypothetical protein
MSVIVPSLRAYLDDPLLGRVLVLRDDPLRVLCVLLPIYLSLRRRSGTNAIPSTRPTSKEETRMLFHDQLAIEVQKRSVCG